MRWRQQTPKNIDIVVPIKTAGRQEYKYNCWPSPAPLPWAPGEVSPNTSLQRTVLTGSRTVTGRPPKPPPPRYRSPSGPGRAVSPCGGHQSSCQRCGGEVTGSVSASSRSARSSASVTLSSDDSIRLGYPGGLTNGLTNGMSSGLTTGLTDSMHHGIPIGMSGGIPVEIPTGLHGGIHGGLSVGTPGGLVGGFVGGSPSRGDDAGWKLFSAPPRHQRRVTLKVCSGCHCYVENGN